jgi:integrase
LTEKEIERLQDVARKRSRYGHRDATMILVAYRHGLRASEVCRLRWDQIDLNSGRLHVRRAKGGIDNVHPLSGKEIQGTPSATPRKYGISLRIRHRAWWSRYDRRFPENDRPDGRSRKASIPDSSSYAPTLDWLQVG